MILNCAFCSGKESSVPTVVGPAWVRVRRVRHLQPSWLPVGHPPAASSARGEQTQTAPLHPPQRLAGRTRHHGQHRGEHRGESQVAVDCVKRLRGVQLVSVRADDGADETVRGGPRQPHPRPSWGDRGSMILQFIFSIRALVDIFLTLSVIRNIVRKVVKFANYSIKK